MVPIGDVNPRRAFPIATVWLITLNVVVFLYQQGLPPDALERFLLVAGVVPYRLTQEFSLATAASLLTAMFVHGGWAHLLSNMLFLWIFGDNIEDRLGILPFLGIYLVTGVLATLAQVAVSPGSTLPIVGASGALAGLAGTYMVLFPWARVLVVVPIFFFVRIVEISAGSFFAFWFAMQVLQGFTSLGVLEQGGVAWFAHIGGFVSGLVAGFLFRGRARPGGFHEHPMAQYWRPIPDRDRWYRG